MIEHLLPAEVATADAFSDLDGGLFPAEAAAIAGAVEKRRREYTSGRILARRALAQLAVPPAPLLSGPRGEPLWPAGIVGAITHCTGYRAVAVAREGYIESIGIDAEPHAPLPDGVLDAVALPDEQRALAGLAVARPQVHWDRLLFSAKEAVFKAWYPLTRRSLGFDEASLSFDVDTIHARLLREGLRVDGHGIDLLTVRWQVTGGLVMTAITVPGEHDRASTSAPPQHGSRVVPWPTTSEK